MTTRRIAWFMAIAILVLVRLVSLDAFPLSHPIGVALGPHSLLTTTERYLGVTMDFADAPCDRLGLSRFRVDTLYSAFK